jgi:hypothetical protein
MNQKPMPKFNLKNLLILILTLTVLVAVGYFTLRFGLSKDNISFPKKDHSHFRFKYIFNGQEENFGGPRYQTDYTKDICNGTLTEAPLHFHDNKTDYQHEHWARMTGGQMLKFYGLNYIGGLNDYMGFKLDKIPTVTPVPIYGKHLPEPRIGDRFWIYRGEENPNNSGNWEIKNRTFDEFINQDFETFFGKESQERKDIEKYGVSYINILRAIPAQAHSGIEHATQSEEQKHLLEQAEKANTEHLNNQVINSVAKIGGATGDAATNLQTSLITTTQTLQLSSKTITDNKEVKLFQTDSSKAAEKDFATGEELKSINNFLGDVVIFVQPDAPTTDQVQARFKSMVKLDKSVCGG